MAADILEQHEGGAQNGQRVGHIGPEVALVLLAQASASLTERLARVAGRDDVDAEDGRPVDGGDVAEVGGVRVAVGEHLARALVDVGHPHGAGAEHFLDGTVEPAVNSPRTATRRSSSWTWCITSLATCVAR